MALIIGTFPHFRPLLAWVLGSLFFFYAFLLRVAPSVMVEELMRDFAVSAVLLGNLSAFYFYAYAGIQLPVGLLMDHYGPRRLMTAAMTVCTAGCLLFALSPRIEVAYLGRLLIGLGAAFGWVGTLTIIVQWFPPQRFALFGGLAQVFGMAGAVFGQAPLSAGVSAFGWRGTLLVVAAGGALLALALWLCVRDRPRPSGLAAVSLRVSLRQVAANPQTWLNALVGLALTGPLLAFAGLWGVPYVMTVYGLPKEAAAATVSLLFIGWAIGAPLMGWLSDRIGRRRPLLVAGGLLSAGTLALILYVQPLPLLGLSALLLLNGMGGSTMVVAFALVREHNPPGGSGAAMGIVNTAVVGSGALFQPLIGWLLDANWQGQLIAGARIYAPDTYAIALSVLPLGSLLGVFCALILRESYCRPQV